MSLEKYSTSFTMLFETGSMKDDIKVNMINIKDLNQK